MENRADEDALLTDDEVMRNAGNSAGDDDLDTVIRRTQIQNDILMRLKATLDDTDEKRNSQ